MIAEQFISYPSNKNNSQILRECLMDFIKKKDMKYIETLFETKAPLPVRKIASNLDVDRRTLYNPLKKLVKKGVIEQIQIDPNDPSKFRCSFKRIRKFLKNKRREIQNNINLLPLDYYSTSIDIEEKNLDSLILFNDAQHLRELGQHQQASDKYLLGLTKVEPEDPLWGKNFFQVADIDYIYGRYDQSDSKLFENLESYSESDLIPVIYREIGHNLLMRQDYLGALGNYQRSLEEAYDIRDSKRIVESYNSLAETHIHIEPMKGLRYLEHSKELGKSNLNLKLEYGKSYYIQADLLNSLGKFVQAEQQARKSISILEDIYASGVARAKYSLAYSLNAQNKFQNGYEAILPVVDYYKREEIYEPLKLKSVELLEKLRCKI